MPPRLLLSALVLLMPTASIAADTAARCMALGKQLGGSTVVIGSSDESRSYSSALAQQNQEIRRLRIEMRRVGCDTGSIVTLGEPSSPAQGDDCASYSSTLASMEDNRAAIVAQRHASLKVEGSSAHNEQAIREEMRQLRCGEIDYAAVPASLGGAEKPAAAIPDPSSSIIQFKSKTQAAVRDVSPPTPEREWDPKQPIRTVGPQFFPDDNNIDLASPKKPSRQPFE